MVNLSDEEAVEIELALITARVEIPKLQQALAEKDREISQLTQSIEMLKYALQGSQDQYQQLMAQAVKFAQWIMYTDDSLDMRQQAQAFLKERETR